MTETYLQVGAEVHYILLWPLGGLAFVGHSSSPARDLAVAIAGPLTHIPQALIWVGILALSAHVVHYPWQHNLHIPDIRTHFWLAVCAGAAQVTSPYSRLLCITEQYVSVHLPSWVPTPWRYGCLHL